MRYRAVVVDPNADCRGGNLPILESCGHYHRSIEAAKICMLKKAKIIASWQFAGTVVNDSDRQVDWKGEYRCD